MVGGGWNPKHLQQHIRVVFFHLRMWLVVLVLCLPLLAPLQCCIVFYCHLGRSQWGFRVTKASRGPEEMWTFRRWCVWVWQKITSWWFQILFIFTPTWGWFPIWLIFFKWVETTNQIKFPAVVCYLRFIWVFPINSIQSVKRWYINISIYTHVVMYGILSVVLVSDWECLYCLYKSLTCFSFKRCAMPMKIFIVSCWWNSRPFATTSRWSIHTVQSMQSWQVKVDCSGFPIPKNPPVQHKNQISNWAMKRRPGCLGFFWGWTPTQFCGDYKKPL